MDNKNLDEKRAVRADYDVVGFRDRFMDGSRVNDTRVLCARWCKTWFPEHVVEIRRHGLFATQDLPAGTLIAPDYFDRINDSFDFTGVKTDSADHVNRWLDQYDNLERIEKTVNCRLVNVRTGPFWLFSKPAIQLIQNVSANQELLRFRGHTYWLLEFVINESKKIVSTNFKVAVNTFCNGSDPHENRPSIPSIIQGLCNANRHLIAAARQLPDRHTQQIFAHIKID